MTDMTDMNDANDVRCPGHSMPMAGRAHGRGGDRPNGSHDTRTTTACVDATARRLSSLFDGAEPAA